MVCKLLGYPADILFYDIQHKLNGGNKYEKMERRFNFINARPCC